MASKEAKTLGAVLQNRDMHTILGESPELFGAYGDVFEWLKGYFYKHKSVPDVALVNDKFRDVELTLPEIPAPTGHYLSELKNEFLRNRMGQILLKSSSAIQDPRHQPGEVLEKSLTELAKLGQYTASSRDVNLNDYEAAEEHFIKQREIAEANGGVPGIATTFDSIDSAYTTGMSGGHFIVLLGYTGRMKSFFSSLLAVKAWEQGRRVMIISLEMTPEEQRARMYPMMSPGMFSVSDMSNGYVDEDTFKAWSQKRLKESPDLIIVSNEGVRDVTPNFIQSKIDQHKPDLVIFDYMQLGKDNAKTSAMTPRMTELSHEMKRLAVSNNLPIIAISAVTDEDGDKRDAPPLLSQISWASAIEYDANLAIAVHAHTDSNIVEVAGRKNRHGPLFRFFFKVDVDKGIWEEKFSLEDDES